MIHQRTSEGVFVKRFIRKAKVGNDSHSKNQGGKKGTSRL